MMGRRGFFGLLGAVAAAPRARLREMLTPRPMEVKYRVVGTLVCANPGANMVLTDGGWQGRRGAAGAMLDAGIITPAAALGLLIPGDLPSIVP